MGATEAGLVQGQDGVIVTALLQGVVGLVPAPGRRLAQPQIVRPWDSFRERAQEGREEDGSCEAEGMRTALGHLVQAPATARSSLLTDAAQSGSGSWGVGGQGGHAGRLREELRF